MTSERGDLQLYRRRPHRKLLVILGAFGLVVVGGALILLVTGGVTEQSADPSGDIIFVPGTSTARPGPRAQPLAATIDDLIEAGRGIHPVAEVKLKRSRRSRRI